MEALGMFRIRRWVVTLLICWYWRLEGRWRGKRLAAFSQSPGCLPLAAGARDGDRWAWDDVRRPDRAHPSYRFGASPALDASQPATFTLWLISYTDFPDIAPDHRVDVSLNGFGLGRIEWEVGKPSRRLFLFRPACWSPPTTSSD
jgi:hypothetical protein